MSKRNYYTGGWSICPQVNGKSCYYTISAFYPKKEIAVILKQPPENIRVQSYRGKKELKNICRYMAMTYRELLALYKDGKLDKVKQREVEADIEKQDAISEYLCEEGEITFFAELEASDCSGTESPAELSELPSETSVTQSEQDFVRTIRKTIRHAFIKR